LLLFDQKIDAHAILKHLVVMSSEGRRINNDDLELLDALSANSEFKSFISANEGNHEKYVAFTFKNDLSRATQYTIEVPKGCPSAEGPLTSTEAWSASFQTYEPLKIVDWSPNTAHTWQPSAAPGQSWSLTFNNSLDHSTINKALFKVEPEANGLGKFAQSLYIRSLDKHVEIHGEKLKGNFILGIEHTQDNGGHIVIYNNSKPNTVYTLSIQPGKLKDIHGQTLEHDLSIQFHVHDSPPLIGSLSGATGT
jgi:hypothetical protein